MSDVTDRVAGFLVAREEVVPRGYDIPVVDMDFGSRGHVRLTEGDLRETLRLALLVEEMRGLSHRYVLPGVFADILWDVTDEKPSGDPLSPDARVGDPDD